MSSLRFSSMALAAALVAPWLAAQTFSDSVRSAEKHPPVCGDVKKFESFRSLNNLPGCTEIEQGACPQGAANCVSFSPYTLVKGKAELQDAPATVAITGIDDLGYYKGLCFLASMIVEQATNFRKTIQTNYSGAYTAKFDGPWELREQKKASDALRKAIGNALTAAKDGKLRNSQAFINAYPAFDFYTLYLRSEFRKALTAQLLGNIAGIDNTASFKLYRAAAASTREALADLQLATDCGAADDEKIFDDDAHFPAGTRVKLQTQTIGSLRAELTAYLAKMETAVDEKSGRERDKWAPYLAAIKGDRLEYLTAYRNGWNVYGPDRVPITRPEDFQKARAMFTCHPDPDNRIWEVRGTHFEGDKKVEGNYLATGLGSDCPSAAFK